MFHFLKKKLKFKTKFLVLMMLINTLTLVFLLAGFLVYDYHFTKMRYWKKYELTSYLMQEPVIKALKGQKIGSLQNYFEEILKTQGVLQIVVFDPYGQVLISMPERKIKKFKEYYQDQNEPSFFVQALGEEGQLYGFIALEPNFNFMSKDMALGLYLSGSIFILLMLLTFILSNKIANVVSLPIALLTDTAQRIARNKDFKLRAKKVTDDEFGVLTDTFNLMLKEIQELEDAYNLQLSISEDSYIKVKFLLEKTEQNKRSLEDEVVERIKSQNELRNIRNHLHDIINSMPSVLVCVNEKGSITDCNEAASMFAKKPLESLMGQSFEQAFELLSSCKESVDDSLANQVARKVEKFQVKIEDKECFYNILIYPLVQGEEHGAVIRLDDVTTQVRMENMMVQTEKMMSVGGLAAGMAHEINNPLGGILQSVQNLSRRIDPNLPKNQEVAQSVGVELSQIRQYMDAREIFKFMDGIKECGERAARIVKNMLQFSRKSEKTQINKCDIIQIINRSIALAENDYDLKKNFDFRKISIKKDFQEGMPEVPCVPTEIEQVILNLLRNAAQAMHEQKNNPHPSIDVRTRCDQDFCHIHIKDNGPGIPDSLKARVFEPFFTTKEVGIGTGLGLSVSYFIIHSKHAGQMAVHSTPGEGTEFIISLPLEQVKFQDQNQKRA